MSNRLTTSFLANFRSKLTRVLTASVLLQASYHEETGIISSVTMFPRQVTSFAGSSRLIGFLNLLRGFSLEINGQFNCFAVNEHLWLSV